MLGEKVKYLKLLSITCSIFYSLPGATAPFESGGLGLSRAEFIKKYEPEDNDCAIAKQTGGLFSCLKYGEIELPLTSSSNVSDLHLKWKTGLGLDESRSLVKSYIPKDSKLRRSYQSPSGSIVDVYFSPSLAARFSSDKWDDKPGEFISIYSSIKNKTILGINNNP